MEHPLHPYNPKKHGPWLCLYLCVLIALSVTTISLGFVFATEHHKALNLHPYQCTVKSIEPVRTTCRTGGVWYSCTKWIYHFAVKIQIGVDALLVYGAMAPSADKRYKVNSTHACYLKIEGYTVKESSWRKPIDKPILAALLGTGISLAVLVVATMAFCVYFQRIRRKMMEERKPLLGTTFPNTNGESVVVIRQSSSNPPDGYSTDT